MSAEKCHICRRDFIADDIRVHDHSHITGYYRGAAHQVCNLNYHESKVLPIVMHNLSGYDSHFIIEPLLSEFEGQVDVLPINKEKYISFTKHVSTIQLRFIDSFRFLADKLENLASYLDNDKKTILKKEVGNDEQFQLLTRKGVFPYEYMSSWEVMKQDIDRFDTADYAPDNVYGIPLRNKKVKGLMSNENNGNVMLEFVGLRSKMYAIRVQNKKEKKRSKGLKKSAIRKLIFEDYKRCLLQNRNSYYVQQSIRSKRHRIHTIKQQKVGLSPYDQKRYITLNSTETKPWGQYNINR